MNTTNTKLHSINYKCKKKNMIKKRVGYYFITISSLNIILVAHVCYKQ